MTQRKQWIWNECITHIVLHSKQQKDFSMKRAQVLQRVKDGKDWRQEEKGTAEEKMVGWCHQLNRHEFEKALRVGDGQEGLACCSPWGCKEWDTTERLNWTEGDVSREERGGEGFKVVIGQIHEWLRLFMV